MSLKTDMSADIGSVFLDDTEFAETRHVGNKPILCVMYPAGGDPADEMAVSTADWVLQARASDLPPNLTPGKNLTIDGKLWTVTEYTNDIGMGVVKLVRNH